MKKNVLKTLLIFVLVLAVLLAACAFVILFYSTMPIAFAEGAEQEDTQYPFYVKAAVSDLEGNEYAGAGAIVVRGANNDTREFLIPESYFIKIVQNVGNMDQIYEVEYAGLTLYIPMDTTLVPANVTFKEEEKFYPDVTLALAEGVDLSALEGVDSALKKLDATYTINFLGYAADPETPNLIYVKATPAEGKTQYGFIPSSAFEAFNVPYQAQTQAERDALLAWKEQETPAPPAGSLPAPEGSLALKIILIIGISLPAVIIVILLFVPSRNDESVRKSRGASSDGRDYDDPSATASSYQSDRQRYDQSRSYGAPRDGYDGYGGGQTYNGNPPYNGTNGQPYNGNPPYNGGGYDSRMDREVRGYNPNDYDRR